MRWKINKSQAHTSHQMVEFSPSRAATIGSEGAEPAAGRQVGDGYVV